MSNDATAWFSDEVRDRMSNLVMDEEAKRVERIARAMAKEMGQEPDAAVMAAEPYRVVLPGIVGHYVNVGPQQPLWTLYTRLAKVAILELGFPIIGSVSRTEPSKIIISKVGCGVISETIVGNAGAEPFGDFAVTAADSARYVSIDGYRCEVDGDGNLTFEGKPTTIAEMLAKTDASVVFSADSAMAAVRDIAGKR